MSDPAGTHNDNGLVFGSQVVTIATVAYIADDIDIEQPTKVITGTNEVGVPNREVLIEEVKTGSATLQLATSGTALPAIGATIPLVEVGGASVNFKISHVGQRFKADGETKVPVQFRKKFEA